MDKNLYKFHIERALLLAVVFGILSTGSHHFGYMFVCGLFLGDLFRSLSNYAREYL